MTDLSADEKTAVVEAEAALARLSDRRSVEDWLCVGRALSILRAAAMRASHSNSPRGRHYADYYGKLLPANLRKNTSKNERTYAINFYEKWQEIKPWYDSNDDAAQRRLVYPANILIAYAKHKRRLEHPDEPVARIQRKRVLDLNSRETMLLSWQTLESLYGRASATRFAFVGIELYGDAPAVAAE